MATSGSWVQPTPTSSYEGGNDGLVPLKIRQGVISVDLLVSSEEYFQLEKLRDDFQENEFLTEEELGTADSNPERVCMRFVEAVIYGAQTDAASKAVLQAFENKFLGHDDIHSLAARAPATREQEKTFLKSYYWACEQCLQRPRLVPSALLDAGKAGDARIVAAFGGQGSCNLQCVQEFAELYDVYGPFLLHLLTEVSPLLENLSSAPEVNDLYGERPILMQQWIEGSATKLSSDLIAKAPYSIPINGLVGLAYYVMMCKVTGLTPGEMRSRLHGATGHSQGIAVAAVVAAANTWEEFYEIAKLVIETLFWIGYYSHKEAPKTTVSAKMVADSIDNGEGKPSSLLSVRGLGRSQLDSFVARVNKSLSAEEKVYVALANSPSNFVLAGPINALYGVNNHLRTMKAADGEIQSRIPFDKRKPTVQHQFLPISAPFHTPYLAQGAAKAKAALSSRSLMSSQLAISVFETNEGRDLKQSPSENIVHTLVDCIMQKFADWPASLKFQDATHVLSFGNARVGDLAAQIKEGYGIRNIFGSEYGKSSENAGYKPELFSPSPAGSVMHPLSWSERFAPRIETNAKGEQVVSTKFTRMMGVPHVLAAGMTPTTVWWDVVSAIMNAGYHAELAGGGYYNAESMSAAIESLIDSLPPGRGITCNVIYSSPRSMAWQIPMMQKLVRKGIPIDGLAIGAGVPDAEVLSSYIESLSLRHITLKPGSYSSIQDVLTVAAAHPNFPIILQWTGGRGGGHHSYEDFHTPILDLYADIRKHDNIYLIAGSGFGGAEDTYSYLTGTWSTELYGRAPMPFDGILYGSRLMVAKEAHTSPQAKELICAAPGTDSEDWTGSYDRPVGGVLTVKSEMGQPIHKIATRGVQFWAEMDKVFALPREKMTQQIQAKKAYIIKRLNDDFAKPYFGRSAGGVPTDLSAMTYAEVISRMIDLMYVRRQSRWVNKTYKTFVSDFLTRTLERLYGSVDLSKFDLNYPDVVLQTLLGSYSLVSSSVIDPDDETYFIQHCKARGQKPVNFVPIIDDNLETWMKKDSLWQSEDVDAVIDQDVGRVCILHGPVAARFSTRSDQTAKEILDEICEKHVEMMKKDNIPALTKEEDGPLHFSPGIQALCAEEYVLRGTSKIPNPLRRVLALPGTSTRFTNGGQKLLVSVYDITGKPKETVEVDALEGDVLKVQLIFQKPASSTTCTLELFYNWHAERNFYQIEEVDKDRNAQVRDFYKSLWLSGPQKSISGMSNTFSSEKLTLTAGMLHKVTRAIAKGQSTFLNGTTATDFFPLDTLIMIGWDAAVKPLLMDNLEGNLLNLVHLSNKAEYLPGAEPLRVGDVITGNSEIKTLSIGGPGKTLEVKAELCRNGTPAAIITSAFLFRGSFKDFQSTFRNVEEPEMEVEIKTAMDESILKARSWVQLDDSAASLKGKTVIFKLFTNSTWESADVFSSLSTKGTMLVRDNNDQLQRIGRVQFEVGKCHGNPVIDFLERKGRLVNSPSKLEQPGWDSNGDAYEVEIPANNEAYSIVSRDCNPIHTSPAFAAWADLPGTITHGMYTSAMVRTMVESIVADGDRKRFRSFFSKFTGMVMPLDTLSVQLEHTAMVDGCMVIDVKAINKATGVQVLEGQAIIEEVETAFVFTGQGSQSKGMGMSLYDSSPIAKKIWDDADAYLLHTYGWSILHVVRENPKSLKVHFGGKRGREIRKNYLALTIQNTRPDGTHVLEPILSDLSEESTSYTFSEPRGLLFSTQFAQPAITLVSKAAFEDMKSKGIVKPDSIFAGHSLGEYGALSAFTDFIPFHTLMSVVFYRGLTMQVAMDRDEHGSTDFSMVAVNPGRVGKYFDEKSCRKILATIAESSNGLLEIVNFNVKGEQYVAAGHLRNIHVLTEVLDAIAGSSSGASEVSEFVASTHADLNSTVVGRLILSKLADSQFLKKPIDLKRGKATIPLKGIDVPFHSTYLRPSVPAYRRYLEQRLKVEDIIPDRFVDKFIPNVMAKPFSLERDYFAEAARLTGSEILKNIAETGVLA